MLVRPDARAALLDLLDLLDLLQLHEARDAAQQLQLGVQALGDAHVREPDLPDEVQLLSLGHVVRAGHLATGKEGKGEG